MVQQNRFLQRANSFIEIAAVISNDFLLKKNIDAENKTITLTYGGDIISQNDIEKLQAKLDSLSAHKNLCEQVFKELKVQFPLVQSFILQPGYSNSEDGQKLIWIRTINSFQKINTKDQTKIKPG